MHRLSLVFGGILAPLLGGALLYACQSAPAAVQPIRFNHRAHVEKGFPCSTCHQSVETAAAATLPTTETCMMCHQGAITDNPEEEKVRQFAAQDLPIPWQRIYKVPDHVYFSHRRHVSVGGIECSECHGQMANMTSPPAYPLVNQTMDWCLECHEARGATTDCIHCHR